MINEERFCSVPFVLLNSRGHGNLRVCCSIAGLEHGIPKKGTIDDVNEGSYDIHDVFNLSKDSIDDIWNSEFMRDFRMKMIKGQYIRNCHFCYEMDKKGLMSKRKGKNSLFLEQIKSSGLIEKAIENGGYIQEKPQWWEIRLSTKCNLACMMCTPSLSSMMYKEFLANFDDLPETKKAPTLHTKQLAQNGYLSQSAFFLQQVKDNLKDIRYLELRGGEVFADADAVNFLKEISESPYAENITIDLSTNATLLTTSHYEILNRFKGGKIRFSIDGYKEENEYIRHHTKWESVLKCLELSKVLKPTWYRLIQSTMSVFQVMTFDRLLWFLDSFSLDHDIPFYFSFTNVRGFDYLRYELIPLEKRYKVIEKIKDFQNRSFLCNNQAFGKHNYKSVSGLITSLSSDVKFDETEYKKFVETVTKLDKIRGKNILDVFPHLSFLFDI